MTSAVELSAPLLCFFLSWLAECKVQDRIFSILYSFFRNLLPSLFILLLYYIKIHFIYSRLRLDLQSGIFFPGSVAEFCMCRRLVAGSGLYYVSVSKFGHTKMATSLCRCVEPPQRRKHTSYHYAGTCWIMG